MKKLDISEFFLICSNMIPIFGVIFLGWSITNVLLMYWAESGVIGVYSIIKTICAGRIVGIPISLFFIFHYGLFMMVHLAFIFVVTGNGLFFQSPLQGLVKYIDVIWFGVLSLFVSHGISFYQNYIKTGKYSQQSFQLAQRYTVEPYGRIILMHLTLIIGAFVAAIFKNSMYVLILFIILKIVVDLSAHRRQYHGTMRENIE